MFEPIALRDIARLRGSGGEVAGHVDRARKCGSVGRNLKTLTFVVPVGHVDPDCCGSEKYGYEHHRDHDRDSPAILSHPPR